MPSSCRRRTTRRRVHGRAEVLIAGIGDQRMGNALREKSDAGDIPVPTPPQSLIGRIHQRHETASGDDFRGQFPKSGAGSTPVGLWQQACNSTASPGVASCRADRSASGRWPVSAAPWVSTGTIRRPAAVNRGIWFGQVGTPSQIRRPGRVPASRSAARRRAPVPPTVCSPRRVIKSQCLLGQEPNEKGVAVVAPIGLGGLLLDQATLRLLDGREYRRVPVRIAIDADTQVHLPWPTVCPKAPDQRQQGVRRRGRKVAEYHMKLRQ